MKLYVYTTDDPDAPDEFRAAAVLILPQQMNGKAAMTPTWTACGRTPEAARAKLEAFWAKQQPKPRKPKAATEDDVI